MEGVFFMVRLTNEERIEIYEQRLKRESLKSLALNFSVSQTVIKYLIRLIEKHGYNVLRDNKNRYYSKEFKENIIKKILINDESITSAAIDIGLISKSILQNWIKKYKENCYNIIEIPRGRKKSVTRKIKKNHNKPFTAEEKIKELEEKNLYLEAELEYLKKLNTLVQEKELLKKKESE